MTNLDNLNLSGTQISDAGMERLKGFTKLELLDLDETNLTDKGLEPLKVLKNMKRISIRGTKISEEGLKYFHASLPECKIENSGENLGKRETREEMRKARKKPIREGDI